MEAEQGGGAESDDDVGHILVEEAGEWSISDLTDDGDRRPRLERELAERDALLVQVQRSHEEQLSMLRARLQEAERGRSDAERQVRVGLAAYDRRTQAELRLLQERLQQMEAQGPGVFRQVEALKASLRDLAVSEASYLEAKKLPESAQSLRDFVTVTVFEAAQAARAGRDALAADLERARDRALRAEGEAGHLGREVDALREQVTQLERGLARASDEVRARGARIEEIESKGELYDQLRDRAQQLERENDDLRRQQTVDRATLSTLAATSEASSRRQAELEQAAELLRTERQYLAREAESNAERCAALQEKVRTLKVARDELVDRLTRVREEHREHYERKMAEELQKLKERTEENLAAIRGQQRDTYEREIEMLRAGREHSLAEAQSAQELASRLRDELHDLRTASSAEIAVLKGEVRVRSADAERLVLECEEKTTELRRLELERERLNEKVGLLRDQYETLRHDAHRKEAALEATVAELRERVAATEDAELEGGRRRGVRHSVRLAEKEREAEGLRTELREQQQACEELRRQLEAAQHRLGLVGQPHRFLAQQVEACEDELKRTREVASRLQHDAEEAAERLARSETERAQLQADLARLVSGPKPARGPAATRTRTHTQPREGAASAAARDRHPSSSSRTPLWFQHLRSASSSQAYDRDQSGSHI